MKQLEVANRAAWREWLRTNHDKQPEGIWLVFRKHASEPVLKYEESVEEALCFGWIDSLVKRINDEKYCRKFTPRNDNSSWSALNKARAQKMIAARLMMAAGLAKIQVAKSLGTWDADRRPVLTLETPEELAAALASAPAAKRFFESLSAACRKQYIGWVGSAKKSETRKARARECLVRLEKGKKLGLK